MKSLVLRYSLMVLFTLLAINFLVNPLLDKYGSHLVRDQLESYYQELLRGPYYVILKYYEGVPGDQIPEVTKALQKEFGFSIVAVSLESDELSQTEKEALGQGTMICRDEWEIYYRRIPGTSWVIRLGPFKELEEKISLWRFKAVIWVSLVIMAVLVSLVAALPFWRSLKKIMTAADRFGGGDLGARAVVSKRSALNQMAKTFNSMAERIGGLIQSHNLLINAVSHELRTPIARIRFGMEMLEGKADKASQQRYMSGIHEDVDDLESMVTELLTYSAFDQKKGFLQMQRIQAAPFFEDLVSRLEPMAGEKQIVLDCPKAPEWFEADPRYLSRALENLMLNGLRHARSLVCLRAESAGDRLRIQVSDDGPGIPLADRERVFEPFVRLDASRSRGSGGHGLGLAIVRQIIWNHQGRVWVADAEGGGACMVVELPVNQDKETA